ncbi:hypothetical protein ACJMK2_022087 [Sinanodonta woodiana]|uniref:GB1/RHD3-type G domain-containing protein n=1 Tax=Sinanodonta woodiana TaxID=1069815 RepID=A0ABD3TJU6_SINWO
MDILSLPVFKEPLCLIESDHDGTLCIKTEVLDQITLLEKKLHIVTIVGLYRTGKSYLLNRLAGANRGFPLGSTIKSQTKGIWAWCQPHPIYDDRILLLMDTEGLGDVAKGNTNHDNWIMALAVLLSSTLVYNLMGTFSEHDLEKLNFVTEISNYIKLSTKGKGDLDAYSGEFFPMFILALRDFSLMMRNDDREITPDEYLEDVCLNVREETTDREKSYNRTRLSIRKYFKTRKCFTFDRPGSRTVLQTLKDMDYVDLSKDFLEDCDKFIKYVHEESPLKKLDNGRAINGTMFGTLVRSYVDAIRNGSVPCVEDALTTMAELENRKLVERCREIYIKEMEVILTLPTPDEKTLLDAHQQCMKKAADYFLEKRIYDLDEKFQTEANAKILEMYEKFRRDNEVASIECCEKVLQDLNAKILEKIKKDSYCRSGGYTEYMADLNELQDKYRNLDGLGCKKDVTLSKFLEKKNLERQTVQQMDQKMAEKEDEVKEEKNRAAAEARQREKLERDVHKAKAEVQDMIREEKENMKRREKKYIDEIKVMKEENYKMKERYNAEQRRLDEELEEERDEIRRLNQRLKKIEQQKKRPQKKHISMQDTTEKLQNEQYRCIIC